MNKLLLTSVLLLSMFCSKAQSVIYTNDIDNFWVAYDSIKNIKDEKKQIEIFKRLYNDKGTEGLIAFMDVKHFSAENQVTLINKLPKFWTSLRPRTALVNSKKADLEKAVVKFKEIHPDLKEAKMYFCIGRINSGGTTQKDKVLIGTEIAMCDTSIDYSEFPNNWLKNLGSKADDEALVALNIHEYAHTQQDLDNEDKTLLLGNAILEGCCDFIANLVVKGSLSHYIPYYLEHEIEIWNQFQQEKYSHSKTQWIGTGDNPNIPMDDLGYAIGYTISKHYYDHASDKKQAIKDMLSLKYEDVKAVNDFLDKSGYEAYLTKKGFKPKAAKIEGYTLKNNTITFTFNLDDKIVASSKIGLKEYSATEKQNFKTVAIVGDFNNWDLKSTAFELQKVTDSQYTVSIDPKKLGNKGETKYFKFVIDGQFWVEPKFYSSNKGSENNEQTNLFIKL